MDHPARKSCNYGNSSGMINERSGPPRAKNTSHLRRCLRHIPADSAW
jgi:hypothetical protein